MKIIIEKVDRLSRAVGLGFSKSDVAVLSKVAYDRALSLERLKSRTADQDSELMVVRMFVENLKQIITS